MGDQGLDRRHVADHDHRRPGVLRQHPVAARPAPAPRPRGTTPPAARARRRASRARRRGRPGAARRPRRTSARPRRRTPSRRSRLHLDRPWPSTSARISADSSVRRTGEATTASTPSAIGDSHSATARTWSRPSSLRPGLVLASPPENRFSVVCAVTPCRTRTSVVGGPGRRRPAAELRARPRRRLGAGLSISSIERLGLRAPRRGRSPRRASPSSASLASRSACWFCSRGTQVYVVPNGASRLASSASGLMSGCLIFQRPDICSTTSLESIRTSMSASGANSSASLSPAIRPEYSATLLVAIPIVGGRPRRSPRRSRRP